MAKGSMINLCVFGVPPGHVYKGWREEEAGPHRARQRGAILLQVGVGSSFPSTTRRRRKERGDTSPTYL